MIGFESDMNFPKKDNDVIAFGEILVDMISENYDENFSSGKFNRYFGGSPSNIAMNVKNLGINSTIVSAVGNDGMGDYLLTHLKNNDIDTSYIQKVNYSTSMVLVTKSKGTPQSIFYREADSHIGYNKKVEKLIQNSKIFHFSCWPLSREPSKTVLEKSISLARDKQLLICFDPNYHIDLWPNGEGGIESLKSILPLVDIVKPSIEDAERIFGKRSRQEYIDEFLSYGVKLVILTLGEEGAIVSNGKNSLTFNSYASEVVDTTGAGDAFWSGFYAALVKGYTVQEAFKLGFKVSAYKLKFTGAVVNLPKLEDVEKMYTNRR